MLIYGMSSHFLKKLMQFRIEQGNGSTNCPSQYFRHYPYQSALSVIGALAGYATLSSTGELSLLTAFGVGYMADSAADAIGGRSMRKI